MNIYRYIKHHLWYVFAGAWTERDASPLEVNIPHPSSSQSKKITTLILSINNVLTFIAKHFQISAVAASIELIRNAKRPVIIVGSQATIPPSPIQAVADSLKDLGIPVFLGGMARGLMGKSHPLQV